MTTTSASGRNVCVKVTPPPLVLAPQDSYTWDSGQDPAIFAADLAVDKFWESLKRLAD